MCFWSSYQSNSTRVILIDNGGGEFANGSMIKLAQGLSLKFFTTTAYSPQSKGINIINIIAL